MSLEEQVATALRDGLDRLEVGPGDARAALYDGDRIRRRRTALQVGAAAAVTAAVVGAAGIVFQPGGDRGVPTPAPTPTPRGQWTQLPSPPLSPRTAGLAVWTGVEAVFLGGEVGGHCPPGADCLRPPELGRDGAAYNPKNGTWREVAAAPFPVGAWTPHAVVGDVLVVVGGDDTWHAYDASEDAWRELPPAPVRVDQHGSALSAADGSVVALGTHDEVMVLDVGAEEWETLPASPHEPRLRLHAAVATTEGVVAIGTDATEPADGSVPGYLHAEVFRDGGWERLGRSEMVGGYTWHWTGDRLVSPSTSCVDGGAVDPYGRCIPEGGVLDPDAGGWEPLPDAEAVTSLSWSLSGAGGDWIVTGDRLYDDADESWTALGAPDGLESYSDTTAVVADGRVIAFGGIDWSEGSSSGQVSDAVWMWTPR